MYCKEKKAIYIYQIKESKKEKLKPDDRNIYDSIYKI